MEGQNTDLSGSTDQTAVIGAIGVKALPERAGDGDDTVAPGERGKVEEGEIRPKKGAVPPRLFHRLLRMEENGLSQGFGKIAAGQEKETLNHKTTPFAVICYSKLIIRRIRPLSSKYFLIWAEYKN